jgi:TetR/AcrR family transcriptional regulator, regulator of mycofactocin system
MPPTPAATAAPTTAAPATPDDAATPSRRERKAATTRRAIVTSARRLFEEHGYAETTVDQIAEDADVAPRTFFRYFPTKEALLFAEFDEERQAMLEALDGRPRDEDPLRSIAVVLEDFARVIIERSDDLAWGYRMCDEQDAQEMYERSMLKRDSHVRIAGFIADRLGTDVDTDPRPMAWSMAVMAVFGVVVKQSTTDRPDHPPLDPATVHAMIRDGFRSTAQALERAAEFSDR